MNTSMSSLLKGPAAKAACVALLAGTGAAVTFFALARRQRWLWSRHCSHQPLIQGHRHSKEHEAESCNEEDSSSQSACVAAATPWCDDIQLTTKADSASADATSSASCAADPSDDAVSTQTNSDSGLEGSAECSLITSAGMNPVSTVIPSCIGLATAAPPVTPPAFDDAPPAGTSHEAPAAFELTALTAQKHESTLARSEFSSKSSCGSASSDSTSTSTTTGSSSASTASADANVSSDKCDEAPGSNNQEEEYYGEEEYEEYDDEEYYGEEDYDGEYDEEEAYMSPEDTKAYVAEHGLAHCVAERELGKGAVGRVDLVTIPLPDGTSFKAARKTLLPSCAWPVLRALLQQELDGLAAADGCEDAVQCLGFRLPAEDGEPAEMLLSYAEGGSVEGLLNQLIKAHFDRIANAPERKRTGKNKDKYEMLPYPGNTLMDERELRAMLRAMVRAIKHMNARGFAHFDLKPDNVLIDYAPDGSKVFRVADFGLAVKTDSSGCIQRAPGGTLQFCALETSFQLHGREQPYPITKAADVASMGLVLAAAAGLHRLEGGTMAYREYKRDLPRRTPPALKELIEWMVAVDPAARPTPDQILAHSWMAEQ